MDPRTLRPPPDVRLLHQGMPDVVAEMADFLLRMDGVDVVLGMGIYKGKGILSLRTSCHEIFAGRVLREVVGDLGTAGGHGMIAGAQISPMNGNHAVQRELESTLTRRLFKALDRPMEKGHLLIVS